MKFSTKYLKVLLSESACRRELSGSGTTSAIITINVIPLITKLHFIVVYFVPDPHSLVASISVTTVVSTLVIRCRNAALAATEFQ
jgi:fumarate reductase subunit C